MKQENNTKVGAGARTLAREIISKALYRQIVTTQFSDCPSTVVYSVLLGASVSTRGFTRVASTSTSMRGVDAKAQRGDSMSRPLR